MNSRFRRPTPAGALATAALVIALGGTGGPVVAAAFDANNARNADKVDGRHAVGAAATVKQRAGKLVATNTAGKLPNSIIAKATDADKVDGIDSSALQFPAHLRPGVTVTGGWGFDVNTDGANHDWGTMVSYPARMPSQAGLVAHVVQNEPVSACPGTFSKPAAQPGHLCVYVGSGVGFEMKSASAASEASGFWFRVNDDAQAGDAYTGGTWAATPAG